MENPAYRETVCTLKYSAAMRYIDHKHPAIVAFSKEQAGDGSPRERAVRLFSAVRDALRYDPYSISLAPDDHRASAVIVRCQ